MAADVKNFNHISRSRSRSDSQITNATILTMDDNPLTLLELSDDLHPTYAIVQDQMRDLILIQEAAIGNLARTNVETLSASRDIFDATVEAKDKKIELLEKSIAETYVSKECYDALVEKLKRDYVKVKDFKDLKKLLQVECDEHAETRERLKDVVTEVNAAREKIKTLEFEKDRDAASFESACEDFKMKLAEAQAENNLLHAKLNEKQMLCEQQEEEIYHQRQQTRQLQHRQCSQNQKHRQQLRESEVERQQEAYMQRMLAERESKSRKNLNFK